MVHSGATQDGVVSPPQASAGGAIPPRSNVKSLRKAMIPPQPSLKHHTVRLVVATAIGIALMLLLLWLAVQYAQRDWQQKNIRARTAGAPKQAPKPAAEQAAESAVGWKYELSPDATPRQLRRLSASRGITNWWPILARGLADKAPQLGVAALRMGLAVEGDNAEIRNDLGAIYLRQKRMKDATAQFSIAEQIEPGFAPGRFNLALCAIVERNPAQASRWLGQYLARRPQDVAALRLQSTLLSQLGQPDDALRMLEKFLKTQPPDQPLYLEAALLAARLGQRGNALRYLETALNGNAIQTVIRAYQSPTFREIRLSGEGDPLAARMAAKARTAFGEPVPVQELEPLRAPRLEGKQP